jgi:hypothetical protein
VIATGPASVVGSDSPAPSVPNTTISPSSPKASTLTASVPTLAAGQIPVIQVNTQAPTAAIAANLANATFAALQSDVNSVAGTDNVPVLQRVVIRPLGPATATSVSQGPGLLFGMAGAVLTFFLACGAIVASSSLAAAWRAVPAAAPGVIDPGVAAAWRDQAAVQHTVLDRYEAVPGPAAHDDTIAAAPMARPSIDPDIAAGGRDQPAVEHGVVDRREPVRGPSVRDDAVAAAKVERPIRAERQTGPVVEEEEVAGAAFDRLRDLRQLWGRAG